MKNIELKTKRLKLRKIRAGDAPQIHEYAGDPSITMMYWLPNATYEETEAFVRRCIENEDSQEFVIIYENRIVGGIGLTIEDETTAYIGWVLNKAYRGVGICTEAALAMRDYAFTDLGITKLIADCDAKNVASSSVMKKIGMQLVDDKGTRTYPKTGVTAPEHVYELNKLNAPAYKIVDYFELTETEQKDIQYQIETRQDLWGALPVILGFLKKEGQPKTSPTEGGFHELLGPGRFLLMLDENNATEITVNNSRKVCPRLAAFVSVARNDEVDIFVKSREKWTPWVSCVFTFPEYRGNRLSEKLIYLAEDYAVKEFDAEYTYISTDHIGLYEKYGYEFFTECETVWGDKTRVLRKKVK